MCTVTGRARLAHDHAFDVGFTYFTHVLLPRVSVEFPIPKFLSDVGQLFVDPFLFQLASSCITEVGYEGNQTTHWRCISVFATAEEASTGATCRWDAVSSHCVLVRGGFPPPGYNPLCVGNRNYAHGETQCLSKGKRVRYRGRRSAAEEAASRRALEPVKMNDRRVNPSWNHQVGLFGDRQKQRGERG